MARRQPSSRGSTFATDVGTPFTEGGGGCDEEVSSSPATVSLAAQAIRASAAHRDASSLSAAYGEPAISSPHRGSRRLDQPEQAPIEYTSMNSLNESKYGFWGLLTRKVKALTEEDKQFQNPNKNQHPTLVTSPGDQFHQQYHETEASPRKSSDALASSLNYIGGTIKNAIGEGLAIVENKTSDIIHETRKLNIARKGSGSRSRGLMSEKLGKQNFPQIQTDYETQLNASRDVANAMAAKAKLLLRELKTVKADLAFTKERCAQLEEENKMQRESQENGHSPENDDLIRLQLETLLAEKARLARENSIYARENRFLREIVEYHQLTMQDVVYLDEGIEEVTEVYSSPSTPRTPSRTLPAAAIAPIPSTPSRLGNPSAATIGSAQHHLSVLVPEDCAIFPTPPKTPKTADTPW